MVLKRKKGSSSRSYASSSLKSNSARTSTRGSSFKSTEEVLKLFETTNPEIALPGTNAALILDEGDGLKPAKVGNVTNSERIKEYAKMISDIYTGNKNLEQEETLRCEQVSIFIIKRLELREELALDSYAAIEEFYDLVHRRCLNKIGTDEFLDGLDKVISTIRLNKPSGITGSIKVFCSKVLSAFKLLGYTSPVSGYGYFLLNEYYRQLTATFQACTTNLKSLGIGSLDEHNRQRVLEALNRNKIFKIFANKIQERVNSETMTAKIEDLWSSIWSKAASYIPDFMAGENKTLLTELIELIEKHTGKLPRYQAPNINVPFEISSELAQAGIRLQTAAPEAESWVSWAMSKGSKVVQKMAEITYKTYNAATLNDADRKINDAVNSIDNLNLATDGLWDVLKYTTYAFSAAAALVMIYHIYQRQTKMSKKARVLRGETLDKYERTHTWGLPIIGSGGSDEHLFLMFKGTRASKSRALRRRSVRRS